MSKEKKAKKFHGDLDDASVMLSTKEKMLARKKKLQEKGSKRDMVFLKDGTIRVRLVSQGPDKELGLEIIQFFLSKEAGSVISPATFGEPCPFMEAYKKLKESKDEDDQALAKILVPKRRYIIGGTLYTNEKGTEIDKENICKPIMVPGTVYQNIIDLYLDEDDWGDMTDKEEGYDIKITRSGKGLDTNYTVTGCPGKKAINPKYTEDINLEKIVRGMIPSYDKLQERLDNFLNGGSKDEEDEKPIKKKKKNRDI